MGPSLSGSGFPLRRPLKRHALSLGSVTDAAAYIHVDYETSDISVARCEALIAMTRAEATERRRQWS